MLNTYQFFQNPNSPYITSVHNFTEKTYKARKDNKHCLFIYNAVKTQLAFIAYAVINCKNLPYNFTAAWKVEKYVLISALLFPIHALIATKKPDIILLHYDWNNPPVLPPLVPSYEDDPELATGLALSLNEHRAKDRAEIDVANAAFEEAKRQDALREAAGH